MIEVVLRILFIFLIVLQYEGTDGLDEMYYTVETHDDEHVNDDEDEFIVPSTKVELIPGATSVITTEPVHDEADDLPASVVVPENVEPVVCEVDPQQNDVQLTGE